MLVLAILALSLATATQNPCALANQSSIEMILGGPTVPVPASEMGEETAPYCLWATSHRENEIKLTIWSKDELPVLNLPDVASYFKKLEAEASAQYPIERLPITAAPNFVSGLIPSTGRTSNGTIVVLRGEHLYVFDFTQTNSGHERTFVADFMQKARD